MLVISIKNNIFLYEKQFIATFSVFILTKIVDSKQFKPFSRFLIIYSVKVLIFAQLYTFKLLMVRLYPRPQTLGRSCFRARRRRTSQSPPPHDPCPPVHHSRPSPRCPFELRLSPGCTKREGVRRLRDSAPPCLHVPLNAVLPPRGRGPRPATAVASSSGSRPYRRSDLVGRR
jgi:hypothetical protein